MALRIGLPQWQHPAWRKYGLNDLADYAQLFASVEGNTTFYATPSSNLVQRWHAMTPEDFRFCFKFPSAISHQSNLQNVKQPLQNFFHAMAPLAEKVQQYWLQLPERFSAADLPKLWRFLDGLPKEWQIGVEVRHRDFFSGGERERALNRGLADRHVNRVILDSRAVHQSTSRTAAACEAKIKKPKLPVHAVLTSTVPLIRFVGAEEQSLNLSLFSDWLPKLKDWSVKGDPILFIHTVDMGKVFELLQTLSANQMLNTACPQVVPSQSFQASLW